MAIDWKTFKTAAAAIGILGTLGVSTASLILNTRIKIEQGQAKHTLDQLKYMNEYELNVYREVIAALKSKDAQQQLVMTTLVEAMPAESPFRANLLKAISIGTTSTETKELATYVAEEPSYSEDAVQDGSWNVDVFWCENEKGGEEKARALAEALGHQSTLGVRHARARKLPKSVNERAGYEVNGLQVRHEEDEEAAAIKCKHAVETILNERSLYSHAEVTLHPVVNRTPGYLSVFLCRDPKPQ